MSYDENVRCCLHRYVVCYYSTTRKKESARANERELICQAVNTHCHGIHRLYCIRFTAHAVRLSWCSVRLCLWCIPYAYIEKTLLWKCKPNQNQTKKTQKIQDGEIYGQSLFCGLNIYTNIWLKHFKRKITTCHPLNFCPYTQIHRNIEFNSEFQAERKRECNIQRDKRIKLASRKLLTYKTFLFSLHLSVCICFYLFSFNFIFDNVQ